MLRDSRHVPDSNKLIYPIEVSVPTTSKYLQTLTLTNLYHIIMQSTGDIENEIKKRGQNAPYLLCSGEVVSPEQLYLVLDQQILCEIENNDAVFALLSAFFVFNVCYPKGCNNVYSFFEHAILNLKNKLNPSVIHFMSSLSALN